MIDKIVETVAAAVADVRDGATVMIGGFGTAGLPDELIAALLDQGARELVVVNNNAGNGDTGLAALLAAGQVRKVVCSFPRQHDSWVFDGLYRDGRIELELVPQGNLAERIRAAGAVELVEDPGVALPGERADHLAHLPAASSAASPVSPLPALLLTTVRSFAPWRIRASIRLTGMPAIPKPPISTVEPSAMSATAASGSVKISAALIARPPR